jgi:hypothetical protein
MLVKVSYSSTFQTGNSSVRGSKLDRQSRVSPLENKQLNQTYHNLMLGVEEVGRVPGEEVGWYQTVMSIKEGGGPLPNTSIRASAAVLLCPSSST